MPKHWSKPYIAILDRHVEEWMDASTKELHNEVLDTVEKEITSHAVGDLPDGIHSILFHFIP